MCPERIGRLLALLAAVNSVSAVADVLAVQCTVDSYRSSFSPRPDLFTIQVDIEARAITTNYGTMSLKMTRRELRGAGGVSGGWQSNVSIDRNTGRLAAGVDKIDGRKYSYADLKGTCILPPELQGEKYKSSTGAP
jgi:hypothetical protein